MTHLYRHFNADGALLYVGISLHAAQRLSQHRAAPWFAEIANVTIEHFKSRADAYAAEKRAIKAERPRFNIMHAVPGALRPLEKPPAMSVMLVRGDMSDIWERFETYPVLAGHHSVEDTKIPYMALANGIVFVDSDASKSCGIGSAEVMTAVMSAIKRPFARAFCNGAEDSLSIERIARAYGISKTALYNYCPGGRAGLLGRDLAAKELAEIKG